MLLTSAGAELLSWNVPHPYPDTTCRSLARTSLIHFQALSHHPQFSMNPKYVCALSFNVTAHDTHLSIPLQEKAAMTLVFHPREDVIKRVLKQLVL